MAQALLHLFCETYRKLNRDNVALIRDIYAPGVRFVDPFHTVEGLPQLEAYFTRLYENVESINFDFEAPILGTERASLAWTMTMEHRRFARPVVVQGATMLEFAEKVHLHRDYFDGGAMVYENVPLLGRLIRTIKARL